MKNKLKIETVTAFVSVDAEGNEGLMAFNDGNQWVPMIGADHDRIISMLPLAKRMAAQKDGMPYRIVKFTTRTDVTEEYK